MSQMIRANITFPRQLWEWLRLEAKRKARKKGQRYGASTYLQDLAQKEFNKKKENKNDK